MIRKKPESTTNSESKLHRTGHFCDFAKATPAISNNCQPPVLFRTNSTQKRDVHIRLHLGAAHMVVTANPTLL